MNVRVCRVKDAECDICGNGPCRADQPAYLSPEACKQFAEHYAKQWPFKGQDGNDLSGRESREEKATRLVRESGKAVHSSDCATSVAPAFEPGPCDCDVSPPPALSEKERA